MKIEQVKEKPLSLVTYSIVTETMKSVTKFKPIEIGRYKNHENKRKVFRKS